MILSQLAARADLIAEGIIDGPRDYFIRAEGELIDLTAHRDARRILDAHDSIAAFLDELPPSA